jgi:TPR repeat protein
MPEEPIKMRTLEKERAYIRTWRREWANGVTWAANNIACSYRILGKHRNAFEWWKRGVDAGDDSCCLETGYCYQYGIGVRRDLKAAETAYKRCIAGTSVSEYEQEEAMFHLAILNIATKGDKGRTAAIRLLRKASRDNDYPQASELLMIIRERCIDSICVCRRFLRPLLKKRMCHLHRKPRR